MRRAVRDQAVITAAALTAVAGFHRPVTDLRRRNDRIRKRGHADRQRGRPAARACDGIGQSVHQPTPAGVILAEIHDILGVPAAGEHDIGKIHARGVVHRPVRRTVFRVANCVVDNLCPHALLLFHAELVHEFGWRHVRNHQHIAGKIPFLIVFGFQLVPQFRLHGLDNPALVDCHNVLFAVYRRNRDHPVVIRVAKPLLNADEAQIFRKKRDKQIYGLLFQCALLLPCGSKGFGLRRHLLDIRR